MKLVYLGAELDTSKEHELLNVTPEGFVVDIIYAQDSWLAKAGTKTQSFEGCTEVHHLWSKDYMGGPSIAFESDIRATGFTRRISDIESVTIKLGKVL